MSSVKTGLPFTSERASTFGSGLPTTTVGRHIGREDNAGDCVGHGLRRGDMVLDTGVEGSGGACEWIDDEGKEGIGFLAPQDGRRPFDRLDGLHIAALAVEDARERVPDLGFRWVRLPFEEGDRRKHHGASRVARLNGTRLDERFLHRVELAAGDVDSFDRRDVVAVCFGG